MSAELFDAISLLSAPFAMCVVLAGIHCYLGMHVLAREVIFVDLSLAQVATLGAAIGVLIGFEHGTLQIFLISLLCTLVAAALFATARRVQKKASQEALIGIVFAFASAAVILVLDRTPHGMEELKESMVGQILWVNWIDVGRTALIYIVVGLVHFFFRKELIASSFTKEGAGWRADFLFYALFGVVITSSTHYAGVLLVFSLLIVPAVLANMFFKTLRTRFTFGWIFGAMCSLLGVALSYRFDFPVGAFIVVLFTSVPIVFLSASALRASSHAR